MGVAPSIMIQEFATGDACTGVAYTGLGTDTYAGDSRMVGRGHRRHRGGAGGPIDGGLFNLPGVRNKPFSKLCSAWIKLPGSTQVSLFAVDTDNVEYLIATSSSNTLVLDALASWDLLPGWDLKVVGNATLTGAGKAILIISSWQTQNHLALLS